MNNLAKLYYAARFLASTAFVLMAMLQLDSENLLTTKALTFIVPFVLWPHIIQRIIIALGARRKAVLKGVLWDGFPIGICVAMAGNEPWVLLAAAFTFTSIVITSMGIGKLLLALTWPLLGWLVGILVFDFRLAETGHWGIPWLCALFILSYTFLLATTTFKVLGKLSLRTKELDKVNLELKMAHSEILMLTELGRNITASRDFSEIIERLYSHVNQLMDASIFTVGFYRAEKNCIEFELAIEAGQRLKPYELNCSDKTQLPVWVVDHREPILIGDLDSEYSRYVAELNACWQQRTLSDGTQRTKPSSVIYVPIQLKNKVLGIISVQTQVKNAYSQQQLSMLETLASYAAIALENATAQQRLIEMALTDELTGIHNRRSFFESGAFELKRAKRSAQKLCLLMFDVDHFKAVNDNYGHAIGDQVLIKMTHACLAQLRETDIFGRLGGEEFAILSQDTPHSAGLILAERVRQTVESLTFELDPKSTDCSISVSLGVIELDPQKETIQEGLKRADKLLYKAKEAGRNQIFGE